MFLQEEEMWAQTWTQLRKCEDTERGQPSSSHGEKSEQFPPYGPQ